MKKTAHRTRRPFRRAAWLAAAVAIASLAPMASMAQPASATRFAQQESPVDYARDVLSQWVETRRLISEESHDWVLGKEMLEDRVALVRQEIEQMRGRMGEMENSIAEADAKRDELTQENERLKEASSALTGTVHDLESRSGTLLTRLPHPIRDRVKPLSQRIPEKPEETELSLSERFMNVVGILNAIDKFNREITVTSEVRSLPDGRQAEVAALYLGISQAYYATQGGDAAGIGTATERGWEWQPQDTAAASILLAIKILQNEEAASFVRLPVILD